MIVRTVFYLLPASTQYETRGSVTASNRSFQWRDQVVDPLFESLPDHVIMGKFANKFGWADRLFRNIEMEDADTPNIESITREYNGGMWTIGYTGCSPERIKSHMGQSAHPLTKPHCKLLVARMMASITVCLGRVGAPPEMGTPGHTKPLRYVQESV